MAFNKYKNHTFMNAIKTRVKELNIPTFSFNFVKND